MGKRGRGDWRITGSSGLGGILGGPTSRSKLGVLRGQARVLRVSSPCSRQPPRRGTAQRCPVPNPAPHRPHGKRLSLLARRDEPSSASLSSPLARGLPAQPSPAGPGSPPARPLAAGRSCSGFRPGPGAGAEAAPREGPAEAVERGELCQARRLPGRAVARHRRCQAPPSLGTAVARHRRCQAPAKRRRPPPLSVTAGRAVPSGNPVT